MISQDKKMSDSLTGKRGWREREAGYVLPMTALLLIPMMIFAAFAVDVGGWYHQGTEQQRAADAAALAAVVWMPDTERATQAAVEVAAQNGFIAYAQQTDGSGDPMVDGEGNPVWDTTTGNAAITVEQVTSQAVRVTIDSKGELYFGGVVLDEGSVDIGRYAIAEYILPVPLGNPASAIGTGNLGTAGGVENMWLAVNAYCTGRSQGDQFSAFNLGSSYNCGGGATQNPQYSAEGYYLIIDFPENSDNVDYEIEFYQPGSCNRQREFGRWVTNRTGVHLTAELYAADSTQLDDYDNVTPANMVSAISFSDLDCGDASGWSTSSFTVNSSAPRGRWVLRYYSSANTVDYGVNYFSVRVTPSNNIGSLCTTQLGAGLDTCPQIFAREHMPIYILSQIHNQSGVLTANVFDAGDPASFFLAEISEEHRGKTLELELYDPGEGMADLQLITPDLSRPTFTYQTVDCAEEGINCGVGDIAETPSDTCTVDEVDTVTPTPGTFPCLNVEDRKYNGKTVRLLVDIPDDYTCSATEGCWWKIRYMPGYDNRGRINTVTDRTVWSMRVIGDPVRLTE